MRISTTTGRLAPDPGARARQLRSLGYDAVDYGGPMNAYEAFGGVYTLPDDEFDAFFRAEGKALADAGLEVWQAHGPYHTIPDDESETDFMRMCIRRAIRATALCGSRHLIIHPAQLMHWATDTDPARTRAYNRDLFAELLPLAHEWNIVLALENMPGEGIPCGTPQSLLDYVDMMDDPDHFTACLDTGHANFSCVPPAVFVRTLGKRISCLHVHDNQSSAVRRGDEHKLPFLGNADWASFLQALKDVGYAGTFSFETDFPRVFPEPQRPLAEAFQCALGRSLCDTYGL